MRKIKVGRKEMGPPGLIFVPRIHGRDYWVPGLSRIVVFYI
jgi:hypothetical protein